MSSSSLPPQSSTINKKPAQQQQRHRGSNKNKNNNNQGSLPSLAKKLLAASTASELTSVIKEIGDQPQDKLTNVEEITKIVTILTQKQSVIKPKNESNPTTHKNENNDDGDEKPASTWSDSEEAIIEVAALLHTYISVLKHEKNETNDETKEDDKIKKPDDAAKPVVPTPPPVVATATATTLTAPPTTKKVDDDDDDDDNDAGGTKSFETAFGSERFFNFLARFLLPNAPVDALSSIVSCMYDLLVHPSTRALTQYLLVIDEQRVKDLCIALRRADSSNSRFVVAGLLEELTAVDDKYRQHAATQDLADALIDALHSEDTQLQQNADMEVIRVLCLVMDHMLLSKTQRQALFTKKHFAEVLVNSIKIHTATSCCKATEGLAKVLARVLRENKPFQQYCVDIPGTSEFFINNLNLETNLDRGAWVAVMNLNFVYKFEDAKRLYRNKEACEVLVAACRRFGHPSEAKNLTYRAMTEIANGVLGLTAESAFLAFFGKTIADHGTNCLERFHPLIAAKTRAEFLAELTKHTSTILSENVSQEFPLLQTYYLNLRTSLFLTKMQDLFLLANDGGDDCTDPDNATSDYTTHLVIFINWIVTNFSPLLTSSAIWPEAQSFVHAIILAFLPRCMTSEMKIKLLGFVKSCCFLPSIGGYQSRELSDAEIAIFLEMIEMNVNDKNVVKATCEVLIHALNQQVNQKKLATGRTAKLILTLVEVHGELDCAFDLLGAICKDNREAMKFFFLRNLKK